MVKFPTFPSDTLKYQPSSYRTPRPISYLSSTTSFSANSELQKHKNRSDRNLLFILVLR